ncbi:DUF6959 family protein [Novosphingobium sp.]
MVEIYSDATNASVMRHPDRKFPGMLIQGDSLDNMHSMAVAALSAAEPDSDQWHDLKELVDELEARVNFYVKVLKAHGLELPFPES